MRIYLPFVLTFCTLFNLGCSTLTLYTADFIDTSYSLGIMNAGETSKAIRTNVHTERKVFAALESDMPSDFPQNAEQNEATPEQNEAPPEQNEASPEQNEANPQEAFIPTSLAPATAALAPALGQAPAKIQCKISERKTWTREQITHDSLRWSWIYGVGVPLVFFNTLLLIGGATAGIYSYEKTYGQEVPTSWIAGGALAIGGTLLLDLLGVTQILPPSDQPNPHQTSKKESPWRTAEAPCTGAKLVGNQFSLSLFPDGTLSPQNEADVVKAWILGNGPTALKISKVKIPIAVSQKQRCRWAYDRGYELPNFCSATGGVLP